MAPTTDVARRELLEVSGRLDAIAARVDEVGTGGAHDCAEQIRAEAGRLRRVLDAIVRRSHDTPSGERGPDGASESEERGRMAPPLDEVVEEMRRRR